MRQTEDYIPGDTLSYNSKELLQRSVVFSTVSYLVRGKNVKQVRDTFLQGFKKNRPSQTQPDSMALAPGKTVLLSKKYQHWHPGSETLKLYF